ncbi:MAG: phage virion morphogenesis protein [Paracoccaceae bacterium]
MITVEFNDAEVLSALDRVARAVTDMTPVMEDIGEEMVDTTKNRFVTGTSPDGSAWAPKSAATIAAYERRDDPVDMRPLWGPTGDLHSNFAWEAGPGEVSWGTNVIYAAVQHFGAAQGAFGRSSRGGPIPWGAIPARPFMGVSEEDRSGILAALEDWLTQAWDPS